MKLTDEVLDNWFEFFQLFLNDFEIVCNMIFSRHEYDISKYCYMSLVMRKPDFCKCEIKGADQLRSNCETDQRLCFCYSDSTIPLLLTAKFQASSYSLLL